MVALSNEPKYHQNIEMPTLLDPDVLVAARRIYRTYCVLHAQIKTRPAGVAIHKENHRGQLIFKTKPILLPGEHFVPLKQLEE